MCMGKRGTTSRGLKVSIALSEKVKGTKVPIPILKINVHGFVAYLMG